MPLGAPQAANDTSWRIRAVASVAVLGLATLLFLQFERGTPEERELALGQTPVPAKALPPERTAPEARSPEQEHAAAPRLPVTAEAPVPERPVRESQAPAAPMNSKVATADKAGAGQGPSDIAPGLGKPPLAAPRPAERDLTSGAATRRDSAGADRATGPEMAGAEQAAGAMKAMPPSAPARALEAARATSPSPPPPAAAPAAAPAARPATQNLEARSRAMSAAAPPDGRNAPTASRRLLGAVASGALEAARQALNDGAPVNAPDAAGQTPLMTAARRGDETMVRLLLAAGADRAHIDASGLTAADHARRAGHSTLLPLLNAPESSRSIPSIPPAPQR